MFSKVIQSFFALYFCLSNGPLAFAIIAWSNMLVFHDLDKITSLFIHISPPILSFCLRWFPGEGELFYDNVHDQPLLGFYYMFLVPLLFYFYWQLSYIFQTEFFDRSKLSKDQDIMTSLRWFTRIKPHPIYITVRRYRDDIPGLLILVGTQAFYTMITLIPVMFMYKYIWVHAIYLFIVFAFATWNGAIYYFDTFTEIYSKRIEQKWNKLNKEDSKKKITNANVKSGILPSSIRSVFKFLIFFIFIWNGGIITLKKLLIGE